jgi:hypothetical protein
VSAFHASNPGGLKGFDRQHIARADAKSTHALGLRSDGVLAQYLADLAAWHHAV